VVIVVIGIVMGSMSNLSWNYIKDLELKTTKEDLMANYQLVTSKVAGSSYYLST
jgi:formylmethanofuran dehydrogenase subunit E-like metal-binding protein